MKEIVIEIFSMFNIFFDLFFNFIYSLVIVPTEFNNFEYVLLEMIFSSTRDLINFLAMNACLA